MIVYYCVLLLFIIKNCRNSYADATVVYHSVSYSARKFITRLYRMGTLRLTDKQNTREYDPIFPPFISSHLFPLFLSSSIFASFVYIKQHRFFEMSPKSRLIPTAIKEMMISWHQKGKSLKEIADLTGRSRATVQSIIRTWKDTGCIENQWHKGGTSKFTKHDANGLKWIIKTNIRASTVYHPHIQNFLGGKSKYVWKGNIMQTTQKIKVLQKIYGG